MSQELPNGSTPKGYAEQFEACSEYLEYNPATGKMQAKQIPGYGLEYHKVAGKIVLDYGFSFEEYDALEKMVDEDVIKMHGTLTKINPADFEN